jgi:hypothetical protein
VVLSDRSQGSRKEITGITTVDEAKEALAMLTRLGVPGDAKIGHYLHVGWTGSSRDDPEGSITSLALWAEGKQ